MTTRILGLASLLLFSACSDATPPPTPAFDAGFISADASALDSGNRDSGRADSGVDAGLNDVGADAGPADVDICARAATVTLTATTVEADLPQLLGAVIALTGTATQSALECTDRACTEDNPCCNDCIARIRVGDVLLAPSECYTTAPRCAGSECSQTCRPPLFGLPQTFRGVLSTATPDLQLLLYDIR